MQAKSQGAKGFSEPVPKGTHPKLCSIFLQKKKKKPLALPQIQNTLSFYFVNKPIVISELEKINITNSFSSCLFVVVVVVIFGCWAISQHR